MAEEFTVVGGEHFTEVGHRLKKVDLGKDSVKGTRAATKKIIPEIEREAREILPHTGGLGDEVASQRFDVTESVTTGTVRLVGSGMKSLGDIDRGRVTHPVFANIDVWEEQRVTPGFFSKPVVGSVPLVHAEVTKVLHETAMRIEKPL